MSTRITGTLARWNAERGFGFITPDGGGADVFVHASDMGRIGGAPQVGWRMTFQVRPGKDGKQRAFDVQREGLPLSEPMRPAEPPRRRGEPRSPRARSGPFRTLVVLSFVAAAAFALSRGYTIGQGSAPSPPASSEPSAFAAPMPEASFTCDGRTRCPQMRSCEEATYFIQHCPNTEMDGDGDGIPCEQQHCE